MYLNITLLTLLVMSQAAFIGALAPNANEGMPRLLLFVIAVVASGLFILCLRADIDDKKRKIN